MLGCSDAIDGGIAAYHDGGAASAAFAAGGGGAEAGVGFAAAGAGAAVVSAAPLSITASTVPTSTVVPACTRIFVSTPAVGAGTSIDTLSVSISNRSSSAATLSP